MSCTNRKTVKSYLTREEHETISKMDAMAGISVSSFVRKVSLGHEVKTFEHEHFKLELIKTRADLGRVGGLLKAALGLSGQENELSVPEIRGLMSEISQLQRKRHLTVLQLR
ncbi:conjugal transfer protein TraJ [Deltaproteobacteria bacterium Smac51]|nr:conjugal transfer protein TraJ [Deltaproteobacteria bacterium Smac51]